MSESIADIPINPSTLKSQQQDSSHISIYDRLAVVEKNIDLIREFLDEHGRMIDCLVDEMEVVSNELFDNEQ